MQYLITLADNDIQEIFWKTCKANQDNLSSELTFFANYEILSKFYCIFSISLHFTASKNLLK